MFDPGDGTRLLLAFAVAMAIAAAATPAARRLAFRIRLIDHPAGYKKHAVPTPYLGGLAMMAGFLVSATIFGDALGEFVPLTAAAVALLAVGVWDDKVGLGIGIRLGAQVAAATVLWLTGDGWDVFGSDAIGFIVTQLWVVGLTNAFNLFDNLDGAAGTTGAVAAFGIGCLAVVQDQVVLAAFAFAVAGGTAGFLPFNLAKPARIFMGDGGSMPLGFLIAATTMALPAGGLGSDAILVAVPLVGLAILDTTLVVASRLRRRAGVLTGARDHLSHRLLLELRSPRRVALVLGAAQAVSSVIGIALYQASTAAVEVAGLAYVAGGIAAIIVFESPRFAAAGGITRAGSLDQELSA
jgi:UDP-GlcNAc:undecaprenyl-phosphate/decaprenyl-phosphate GlcNAc-1-phosphate transferase